MKNFFILTIIAFCLVIAACSDDYKDDHTCCDGDVETDGDVVADGDLASDGDIETSDGDTDIDGDTEFELDIELGANSLVVMTYNVLCFFCNNEYDEWDERLDYHHDIFARHNPDLIGLQEPVGKKDILEIVEHNPGYSVLYFHDDNGPLLKDYPDASILYKTDRFEVVDNGFYFLGNNPDEPWSGFEDKKASAFWRLVAWVHLREIKDGREFLFANTHFDNNTPHQELSAPIVLAKTAPFAENMPVIVVGDFNSKPDSEAYKILTKGVDGKGFKLVNSFDLAEKWSVDHNQDTEPDYAFENVIDHIFIEGQANWTVKNWVVDMHTYGENKLYPSDHLAITAELEYTEK